MSYNTELQSNNADLQEILDAVNALPEAGGGVELPELTNPGTAEDLEADKQLIDAEGNIVTGTVRVAHGGIDQEADSINRIPMGDQSRIKLTVHVEEKTIVKPSAGNAISLTAPCSEFGDAAAEDVVQGKTFTSAAGLKVVGTNVPLDTADATATAEQMAEGVTAYVNGEKVTGTAKAVKGSYSKTVSPQFAVAAGGAVKLIEMQDTIAEPTFFGTTGATRLVMQAQTSEFGDAKAADVAKGKTFTSAAGLKVVGTREESSGGESAETCTVTIGCNAPMMEGTFYYVDASGAFQSTAVLGRYTVQKNCLVVCTASGVTASGAERVLLVTGLSVFYVTGDCTITFS